jgi:hypothetical protein
MRKMMCGLLLCAVILTGCQGKSKKTNTPAAPAHNVPPAVYPGAKSGNPPGTDQASQAYPGPKHNSSASVAAPGNAYPGPAASAASTPVTGSFAPAAGDEKLDRGEAFVEMSASELILAESAPQQVKLHLKGTLPNPCYQLRVNPAQPDYQKHIQVEVYSVTQPGKMCTEVLQDFNVIVPLENFSGGHYSVYINGELLGEFDA